MKDRESGSDAGETLARDRYFTMIAAEMAGVAGAVFGLVLIGRAQARWQEWLGAAIVVAAMAVIAIVPRAMARRWRSAKEDDR